MAWLRGWLKERPAVAAALRGIGDMLDMGLTVRLPPVVLYRATPPGAMIRRAWMTAMREAKPPKVDLR